MKQTDAEIEIQGRVLLECNRGPVRLFRNPMGAIKTKNSFVKYGLANPGGSDLIGWRTINGIAQFVALEMKAGRNQPDADQRAFLDAVQRAGGCCGVAWSVEDARRILGLNI